MRKAIIYQFKLCAVSPVYFGDSNQGELVMNARQEPIVLGNTIGGALRDYLNQTDIAKELIRKSMGGSSTFDESNIYISDGEISHYGEINKKEGTAIDPEYGTAKDKHKYSLYHLPEGTNLTFYIESDQLSDDKSEKDNKILSTKDFEKIIGTWAKGFATRKLRLGGQKSNGFGVFDLEELRKKEFQMSSIEAIDQYLLHKDKAANTVKYWGQMNSFKLKKYHTATFSMSGCFPYGVYQNFPLKEHSTRDMTGLKNKLGSYYIPATSLKGLIKNEVRLLIKRMMDNKTMDSQELDKKVEEKCSELFGSSNQRGKLVFTDMVMEKDTQKVVEIDRCKQAGEAESESDKHPVYIKIDRLTGGAYPSALKHQQEIQGKTKIDLYLLVKNENEDEDEDEDKDGRGREVLDHYLFPIIYVLRKIGSGVVPIGGRTVIGLGQFEAETVIVEVEDRNKRSKIEVNGPLSDCSRKWLEDLFTKFKGWCSQ